MLLAEKQKSGLAKANPITDRRTAEFKILLQTWRPHGAEGPKMQKLCFVKLKK